MKPLHRMLMILVLLAASLPGAGLAWAASEEDYRAYAGGWRAEDVFDQSTISLLIRGGLRPQRNLFHLTYHDDFVAPCLGSATATGRGTVVDGVLYTNLDMACDDSGYIFEHDIDLALVLEHATPALSDAFGNTYRLERPAGCRGR